MSNQQWSGPSDAELARQLVDGDPAALGELYDRHVPGVHDFLSRFTRDPAAAEDLAHSTFLRAWERRETLRDPSKVRAWLYATAHHLALNHATRTRSAASLDDEAAGSVADPSRGPEEEALALDAAELVWSAASSLEARQYAVLDLSVRQGLSTREVADVLEVPVSHAAVLVNRSREALGNAVRYLLVARRRDHCERLAALVPAGVRALTAEQRRAVDHHMRRCEDCQDLGRRLTAPAELLGALLPVELPSSLGPDGRDRLVAAVRSLPAGTASGVPPWPPQRRSWEGRLRWAGGLIALLLLLALGGTTAAYVLRPSSTALFLDTGPGATGPSGEAVAPTDTPTAPAPLETVTPDATPSPSPSTTPTPSASASAAVPGQTPTPTPSATATPTPTPTPTAGPPFRVLRVSVVSADEGSRCTQSAASKQFTCHFTITVGVENASAQQTVTGTVIATSANNATGTANFDIVVEKGATSASTAKPVPVTFACVRSGTASATTKPPADAASPAQFSCLQG